MRRTSQNRETPSAVSGFLALVVVVVIASAGACTTTSAPERAGRESLTPQLLDDPQADELLLRGEWEETVRLHRALLEKDPGNGRAHYHLGYASGQLGNFSEEIAAYREAVRLGLRDVSLYYNLGIALATAREDYDGAIAAFEEGLHLSPDDPELWYNLGAAYLSKREFARARDAFQAALELAPDHVEAQNNLGHALLGLGDRAGARAAWQKVLAMDPENLAAKTNLHLLDQQKERVPKSNGLHLGFDEYRVR